MTRVYVSVIVRNSRNQILLLKRANNSKFAAGQWEFVNGSIGENETAEETAIRELDEETKLVCANLTPLSLYEISDDDGRWIVIPYETSAESEDVLISDEHSEFKWADEQEIKELIDVAKDYELAYTSR